MKVLITNNSLATRAGSELYVRDLAIELLRRGHHPVVYSTQLGAIAEELRAATVPVIESLNSVLCAPGRLGPMVTTGNFASLRQWNFGIRTLAQPLGADLLTAELRKYDREDAALVSQVTRATCEMQPAVGRILDVYRRVLADGAQPQSADRSEAGVAAAQYLERWAKRYKNHFTVIADRDRWIERCNAAEQPLAEREDQLRGISRTASEHSQTPDQIAGQRERWIGRCSPAESALAQQERFPQDAEQQALRTRNLLRQRDAELALCAQELAAIRSSATWRWTQRVIRSSLVQLLFGGFIRLVAERHRTLPPPTVPVAPIPSSGRPVPESSDPAAHPILRRKSE